MNIKTEVLNSIESFEDIYAKGYDKKYPSIELVRIASNIKLPKNSNILDFGCGPGSNGMHFLNNYNKVYFADISLNAINLVKSKINNNFKNKSDYTLIDPAISKLPYKSNHFDLIICMSVYNNFVNREHALQNLREFNRIIKKNSYLILDFNLRDNNNYTNITSNKNDVKKTLPNKSTDKQISMYFPKTNKSVENDLRKNSFKIIDIGYSHWKVFDSFEHESIITAKKI
ncbi:MAG: hypothetical protein CMG07_02170 [Candidatus Marinimicrobia bacterium]|nr:hypothetical protein [Candidatus Neomarinimicrobiota bacterium]